MNFFNSRDCVQQDQKRMSLREAVLQGQAENGGLFIPTELPKVSTEFLSSLPTLTDQQIVEELAALWLSQDMPDATARQIAREAINFQTPLIQLSPIDFILELFHGPTLAFKDFGARFLARLLAYFLKETSESQTILVATSGDTGSAVAAGFWGLANIRVVVLYPGGRVSDLQEMQMTTLGENTYALRVNGTFDDCQKLVKTAFVDEELRFKLKLNSANSINIGRLIAQTFYYFIAAARLPAARLPAARFPKAESAPVFVVPSGNLGNLCAGIFAMQMGLPVKHFIAATNANNVFPEYLATGKYEPRPSISTISNAMDVGAPSNLERLLWVYGRDVDKMRLQVDAFSISDIETKEKMKSVADQMGYVMDPHTAVGYAALEHWRTLKSDHKCPGIVLSTAHPAKFQSEIKVALPPELATLQSKPKHMIPMENSWPDLKNWLLKL